MNKLKTAAQKVADIADKPRYDNGPLYTAINELRNVLAEGSDEITVGIKVDTSEIVKAIAGARVMFVSESGLDDVVNKGFNLLTACAVETAHHNTRIIVIAQ